MKYESISVFFPALNEQENIKKCILNAQKYLNKRFKDYEIIVVTSGSRDNTEKIVKDLAKKDKRISSLNDGKKGYGAALKLGFSKCSKKLFFYTDGDNQFNIDDMDLLLPMLTSYDIVSAYRLKRKDPLMRIFVANIYNILIRTLFNLKVKDIDAAFKLYKKEVFKKMKLKANTGLIDAEVLIKAQKLGFSIGQIGITHYPRINGQTSYEVGNNKIFVLVKPKVVTDILSEMRMLWSELR